ncbi:capsular biosynthesis protein [Salipaludibacillus keqinensis]|uniref:Capsular biosynthesis protein n=1 Tax=Salipaludibacillus keqinensis TaxID=2045207 RepID=A0A323TIZ5_9BACI|nr:EpsG family protein [Salipaludibacillus keqinensis]PYZ95072.1 capsular biosynthesis protein [Salipaludibacillus keqinensis]
MGILWLNLATVFGVSLTARYFSRPVQHVESTPGSVPIKPNVIFALLALTSLVLVSGLRRNIGDTYVYRQMFESNKITLNFVMEGKDRGFGVLQLILQQYTNDGQVLIFISAFITLSLIVGVLYKYSRLFELSLYVFIASGMFLVSMNGMRQYIAAAIIFAGTKFILDGHFFKFTALVLLASTFHQSALVLLPIYFLVRREAWSWGTMGFLLLAVISVAGYHQISELLFSAISDTQYGGYSEFEEGGANVLRVAVSSAPLILAFIGRHRLRELFPKSDYIVNLSMLCAVFMLISTQNWIFARFAIYFDLFNLILLSWVVKIFPRKEQTFVYYMIVLLYLGFFIYEYIITLNIQYRSDYILFFQD